MLRPEPAIFGDGTRGSAHRLLAQLQGLALAFPGIAVSVHDETAGTYRLSYPRGLSDRLDELDEARFLAHDTPICFHAGEGEDTCSVALRFALVGPHTVESFVNARRVTSGGVHVDALLDALDRRFGRRRAPPLSAVFSLRLGDPRWAGSVKECLLDPRAYDLAARALATLPGAVAAVQGDLSHAGTADQRDLRTRSTDF